MAPKKIKINPEILKWARESAHLDISEIPKSTISTDLLIKIEKGTDFPSFTQLQRLAKKYERSLGVLMGDKIPELDYQKIPFFRKENQTDYDSSLVMFIRDIQDKQDWARNYLLSEGNTELDFIGSVSITANVNKIADRIKERLDLPHYRSFSNRNDYLKALKVELEEHGVFISITGSNQSNKRISLEQAQGLAISDPIAPFVFVNTKNTTNAKIFTLIHEIVHLFLNESGISEDALRYRKPECKEDEIENFCNNVAGEVLMPKKQFLEEFNRRDGSLEKIINDLSNVFFVSELAICMKLWRLNLISFDEYRFHYESIEKKIKDYLLEKEQKERSGGSYYNNMRSKNGVLFSYLVYSAYKSGEILSLDLSKLLKIKTNNIENYFATL